MNISDIVNSITNTYFDYGDKRYYFDKIVSHDLEIKAHVVDKSDSMFSHDFRITFSFKFIFSNDILDITTTKFIPKYLNEIEKKKFLWHSYEKEKINPAYLYLKKHMYGLYIDYYNKMEKEQNIYQDYPEYLAYKLDAVDCYKFVKIWKDKLLAIYEEYNEKE